MSRYALFFTILFLLIAFLCPQASMSAKPEPTIADFRVEPLYRAVKLTWNTSKDLKKQLSLQILRADTFEEGPYKQVDAINLVPGKSAYNYIDKSMGSGSKYYYKLVIKETGESFGPIVTRPYFSPPATQLRKLQQEARLLALGQGEMRWPGRLTAASF